MRTKPLPSPPPVKPATRGQAFRFLRGLQEFRGKDDKPPDEAAIKDYLNRHSLGSLQGISSRIMMDILKSPTADVKPARPQKGKPKEKRTPSKSAAAKKSKKKKSKKKKRTAGRKAPKKKASRKK
jgi:hypothetical protein